MAFLTFNDIQRISNSRDITGSYQRLAKSDALTVFLSHSSKDDQYVIGVSEFLSNFGARVYSDNGDKRLPATPSPETAQILRDELQQADRVVVMVSENSSKSGWIPWELGMADGHKGVRKIALLPIVNTSLEEAWASREYLGLYPVIRRGRVQGYDQEQWMVDLRANNGCYLLNYWLTQRGI